MANASIRPFGAEPLFGLCPRVLLVPRATLGFHRKRRWRGNTPRLLPVGETGRASNYFVLHPQWLDALQSPSPHQCGNIDDEQVGIGGTMLRHLRYRDPKTGEI